MSELLYDTESALKIAHALNHAFIWENTKQRRGFWDNLHEAFKALANDDQFEFEELLEKAVKNIGFGERESYRSWQPKPDRLREIQQGITSLCCWSDTLAPTFWLYLHDSFYHFGTPEFDIYIETAVRHYHDV